ncbi:MAG: glycoside hydrolase family 16 protein [Janthinobacterium lividum]
MGALLALAQAASLAAANYAADVPMTAPVARPSWADEFQGSAPDDANWRYDIRANKTGWPNDEKEYYSDHRPQNARVEHGALVIEARAETLPTTPDWGGQAYTSARLVSRRAMGYGFYEVRAKLPCGRGTWPAIWLLPEGGRWPDAGEIDVMEMVGWQPNVVHATVHSAAYNHRLKTQRGAEAPVATACAAWHRYQLDWRPHSITIGVDGHGYMRVADDKPGGAAAWPFTRPYQMILNVAVGGSWGGAKGIDDAALPQAMSVDYVRYWAAAD